MLSAEQKDALREYMNIFMGQAASHLFDLVNQKIVLSISDLKVVHSKDNSACDGIEPAEQHDIPLDFQGNIVSSSIRFGKQFSGKAHLIFTVEATQKLIKLCMNENLDPNYALPCDLTDTDYDAIKEIGNTVLNSITGGFGNLLGIPLEIELPEVKVLSSFKLEENDINLEEKYLLIFYNSFSLQELVLEGAVVVVLSIDSINMLLHKIDEVLMESEA